LADSTTCSRKGLFEEAVKQHDLYFQAAVPQGRRLTEAEVGEYRGYHAGWRSSVKVEGEYYPVDVLLPADFPFAIPRLALVDKTKHLSWPHVEPDGGLCLMHPHENTVISTEVMLVDYLLNVVAPALIKKCLSGTNQQDFITEFQSYWPARDPAIWSLLPIIRKCQVGVCWQSQNLVLMGEDEDQVKRWLQKYHSDRDGFQAGYTKALYVWLTNPPIPAEYPQSGADFRRLLLKEPAETQQFFFDNYPLKQDKCLVLFGFNASKSLAVCGMWLRQSEKGLDNGYRTGKTPRGIGMMRYHGNKKNLTPIDIQRVDSTWIHSRGGEKAADYLQPKSVVFIGCGSIGSLVAETLIKAGVGNFSLYDPDRLSWDNVARHALGGGYVGIEKSVGLAKHFQKHYPHITCQTDKAVKWEQVYSDDPKILANCDLIISTIGDWLSEAHLNYLHRTIPEFPPVLYGWTEAHACAGHALLVKDLGGCLCCGMDEIGNFQQNVMDWAEPETMEQVPACGAFYQPYGIADLLPIVSMIANVAIQELSGKVTRSRHSIWVGSEEKTIEYGGRFSPAIFKDGRLEGSRLIERDWGIKAGCQLCR